MRLMLFGDGEWASQTLVALRHAGHEVCGVVVRLRPSNHCLSDLAGRFGIPVLQPADVNAAAFAREVAMLGPELNISIAYNQIIRPPLLDLARCGFINVHAGKLPRYRGRNIINWAIINGEPEVGLTVHYIDSGIDTGDIILQQSIPVSWTDTYGTVLARVVEACPPAVVQVVDLIARGAAPRRPQGDDPGTYFGARGEADEWLDWSDSSRNLHNKIRAISEPAPCARTLIENATVRIHRAYYDPAWPAYLATPGQVVGRSEGGVIVKTGDSVLRVEQVSADGSEPRVPAWRIGTRLGVNMHACIQQLTARCASLEEQIRMLRNHNHGQNGD
jgi:methionyl-tRNA formyltransferase